MPFEGSKGLSWVLPRGTQVFCLNKDGELQAGTAKLGKNTIGVPTNDPAQEAEVCEELVQRILAVGDRIRSPVKTMGDDGVALFTCPGWTDADVAKICPPKRVRSPGPKNVNNIDIYRSPGPNGFLPTCSGSIALQVGKKPFLPFSTLQVCLSVFLRRRLPYFG